jgi:hypothetical protein
MHRFAPRFSLPVDATQPTCTARAAVVTDFAILAAAIDISLAMIVAPTAEDLT